MRFKKITDTLGLRPLNRLGDIPGALNWRALNFPGIYIPSRRNITYSRCVISQPQVIRQHCDFGHYVCPESLC
jgi:hypothetical protein